MPPGLEEVLVEALNDEYKARATYRRVIAEFGEIRPFINIVESENRHIQALLPLFEKYGVRVPEDDWDERVAVPDSVLAACRAAVEAEVENAAMYARLLEAAAQFPDVCAVLRRLQQASAENHLPAFRRCVERGGAPAEQGRGRRGRGRRRGT